jgi:hypothetical protein
MNPMDFPKAIAELSDKSRQEVVAALVIEALRVGLEMEGFDPGGGSEQRADFKMVDPTGADIGRLEVTTTTRPDHASFDYAKGKFDWSFTGLTWLWTIKVRPSASLKALHKRIESILSEMEAEGPPEDWVPAEPGLMPGDAGGLRSDLSDLGVVAVSAVAPQQPGCVAVHANYGSGSYSRSAVSWEAQAPVDDEGNRNKLSVPGMRYSELFVWLGLGDGQVAIGTLASPPFSETLNSLPPLVLPEGMTGVWVASGMASWPRPVSSLLHFEGTSWQLVDPPTLSTDNDLLAVSLDRLLPR